MRPPAEAAGRGRRLVGVSLKAYFGLERTRRWVAAVVGLARDGHLPDGVDVFVIPDFVSLTGARELLDGTGVQLGAQDVFWADGGAFTGEVCAPVLAEAGCRYVEVGHAERRRLFGEDDAVTARKAGAAARAGLVPLVCVGETENHGAEAAAKECLTQLAPVLDEVGPDAELVIAYEPVWAIGAAEPAGSAYIAEVAAVLRAGLPERAGTTRLIYGGSAGPGLFTEVSQAVDGLFLGRFAHDTENLRAVLAEVAT